MNILNNIPEDAEQGPVLPPPAPIGPPPAPLGPPPPPPPINPPSLSRWAKYEVPGLKPPAKNGSAMRSRRILWCLIGQEISTGFVQRTTKEDLIKILMELKNNMGIYEKEYFYTEMYSMIEGTLGLVNKIPDGSYPQESQALDITSYILTLLNDIKGNTILTREHSPLDMHTAAHVINAARLLAAAILNITAATSRIVITEG